MSSTNQLLTAALQAQNIKVLDKSAEIHAIPFGSPLYRRNWDPIGIVMHNTDGLILLENLASIWALSASPPPSHLGIDQSGRVAYYVRLEYADRATENTNKHISIEFQAVRNGDITSDQIKSAAVIYAFLHDVYGIEFAIANSRTDKGLAHHSLFVDPGNPKGHFFCPGDKIIAQKPEIIALARHLSPTINFGDDPTGVWTVKVDRFVWTYEFRSDGLVQWRDPFNGRSGYGLWTRAASEIRINWNDSKTKEHWDIPFSEAHTGECAMEGEPTHIIQASRKTN